MHNPAHRLRQVKSAERKQTLEINNSHWVSYTIPGSLHVWSSVSLSTPWSRTEDLLGLALSIKISLESPRALVTPGQAEKAGLIEANMGAACGWQWNSSFDLDVKWLITLVVWKAVKPANRATVSILEPTYLIFQQWKIVFKREVWLLCAMYIFVPHLISLAVL